MIEKYRHEPVPTTQFKKDLKLLAKRRYDLSLIRDVIHQLAKGEPLAPKYNDHPLHGKMAGKRSCHVLPDWVLIYQISKDKLYLYLVQTGSHADVYRI